LVPDPIHLAHDAHGDIGKKTSESCSRCQIDPRKKKNVNIQRNQQKRLPRPAPLSHPASVGAAASR